MKTDRFNIKWNEFVSVLGMEFKHIFTDAGLVLVCIIAMLFYSTVYSLGYKNEVLRKVPVGVVDLSKSASSRKLINTINAAPNIDINYAPESMEEAKRLFYERDIYGVVYIPEDYEDKIMRGEQAIVGIYVDGSYFLMYRQVFYDAVGGINDNSTKLEINRLLSAGASVPQAEAVSTPVVFKSNNLFNPYTGYGTFVIPPIIIVIIQQTLLIGIGMAGGTWREFGLYKKLKTPGEKRLSTIPIVAGKAAAYLLLYMVTVTYLLGIHFQLFHLPVNGRTQDLWLFMLPYLLSCIFMGIAISTLFRYRENSLMFMLWTSIPILLISGVSLPKEAIPEKMLMIGKFLPSSSGIDGFLRIQIMGADIYDVWPQYRMLWILTAVYFVLACIGIRHAVERDENTQTKI